MRESISKYDLQGNLFTLWKTFYKADVTDEQRVKSADEFLEIHIEYHPYTIKLNHPQTRRKDDSQKKLIDIIGDFILRAEDDTEHGTISAQTERDRELRDGVNMTSVDYADHYNDEEDIIDGARCETEHFIYANREDLYETVEDILFREQRYMEAEDFAEQLQYVKDNAEEYARKYAKEYGLEYKQAVRRINRLDISRVATCEECGDAFYKHDLRRKYCDMQGKTCESSAKRRNERNRYEDRGESNRKSVDNLVKTA